MVTTSRILDANGQPFQLSGLAEPQTSRVGQLHQEWQGHPARGLTPTKLNSILLNAEQGDVIAQFELFEDMEERDAHILSEMSKRRRAVSGLTWDIVPPSNPSAKEKRNAEALKEILEGIEDIESVLFDTTDAIGKGFSCQEIEWQMLGGNRVPKSITHRPQSWFRLFRGKVQQEVRLRDYSADGAPLQPFGWITHSHKARSGYLERASLFRSLVWPYLFKNYSVGDLAEFLEIYGIPLRIGKYAPGASDKEKATLLRALVQLGRNAAGIIPEGMSIDFEKAADGDADAFQLMMDWCERSQSKVILGATLTSQADRGSNTNALGNVHNEVRKELKDSDAKQVASSWSRDLVYPVAALNGLAPDGFLRCPRLRLDVSENKDIKVFADALPTFVGMGMKIKRAWVHNELGIPEAEDDKDILVPEEKAAALPPMQLQTALTAAAAAQLKVVAPPPPDRVDQLTAMMRRRADAATADMVDQVRQVAMRAQSLTELLAGLEDLQATMSVDEFAVVMADALTVSGLAGMSDAIDDADA